MLTTSAKLEIKINEKNFQFFTDNDAPLSDVKEALFQFLKYVGQVEDAVKSQQDKAKSEEKTPESPVEEKIEQIG
jgi:hypothetical protein